MSQYKNLFKSSRIPKAGKDEILKTDKSKHIMIQCRGRFYQLNVLNDNHDILGFEEIYKGVECIWNDACGKEYNEESSVAWLSSWTRDEWANAREHLVSTAGL
jgi:carnitine O-palmitoyltransferase 2